MKRGDISDLFFQPTLDDCAEMALEKLRAKGLKYRAKVTRSGDGMLEVEIYPINPVWVNMKGKKRAKGVEPTREAQRNLNCANTRKHISRLIHCNFTRKDIWVTFNYGHEYMPADLAEATKHLKNYFKRLRRYLKKHGLPALKYIYVTERVKNEKTGKVHTHHHIVMNVADRDIVESLWKLGGRSQARRLQPDVDGSLEGLARYIAKPETKDGNRKGAKTYGYSLNLTKPEVRRSSHRLPGTNYRLSKKRVAEMATDENRIFAVLEESYGGYRLVDKPVARFSDYAAGAYVYARMVRKPGGVRRW